MKATKLLILFFFFFYKSYSVEDLKTTILPGAYQTELYFPMLKGNTLGIVSNQTSIINGKHLVDSLLSHGFKIKCVFAPEHGFRGKADAGAEIKSSVDIETGLPIVSLYGKHLGPDSTDLTGIDIVIFDIQDVGARFYTYISTLQYVMEACADYNKKLIVLDRPNPNGFYIDGPVLEENFKSFVGMQPVPVVYGMTIGEYARMLNGKYWLRKNRRCDLTVIPVKNYTHDSLYQLPVSPSPNLKSMDAIYLYPTICFFEGTRLSLGRGTDKPFQIIGYPENKTGDFSFTPERIPGVAEAPVFRDTLCVGINLTGEGIASLNKKRIQMKWLLDSYFNYPDKQNFFIGFFEKISGTKILREQIQLGKSEEEIRKSWQPALKKFKSIRKKYLLYKDFTSR